MKVSFVDFRKKSSEIIKALKRKERVAVFYRGKPAAIMHPIDDPVDQAVSKAEDHPAFGLWAERDDMKEVSEYVRRLRAGRFNAL